MPSIRMKEGTLLKNRFALRRLLGQSATGATWLADDRQTGRQVVVKLLSFALLQGWKAYELFEREAKILSELHHPGIPAYVDFFRWGSGATSRFVLVQEHVKGKNLQELVDAGWRGTEEEITAIALRLLEIVRFLHSLHPPVIHRDINPRNIIRSDNGEVYLVDFGGAQESVRLSEGAGSTIVGTAGYMPLEQFIGKATVRSDLYACAATILFMLTHRNPQDFPRKDMRIDFSSAVDISPSLASVLNSWLEPDEARRTLTLEMAIRYMNGEEPPRAATDLLTSERAELLPPHLSRIRVERENDVVTLTIPERGTHSGTARLGGFSAAWMAFLVFWTFATIVMKAYAMTLFSIPFWGAGFYLVRRVFRQWLGKTVLTLDPRKGFSFSRYHSRKRPMTVPFAEVRPMTLPDKDSVGANSASPLQLEAGARGYQFGGNLSLVEKEWIVSTVNDLVKGMGGG